MLNVPHIIQFAWAQFLALLWLTLGKSLHALASVFSSVIMGIIMSTHRAVEKFNWVKYIETEWNSAYLPQNKCYKSVQLFFIHDYLHFYSNIKPSIIPFTDA